KRPATILNSRGQTKPNLPWTMAGSLKRSHTLAFGPISPPKCPALISGLGVVGPILGSAHWQRTRQPVLSHIRTSRHAIGVYDNDARTFDDHADFPVGDVGHTYARADQQYSER